MASNLLRRAGAVILRFLGRSANPTAERATIWARTDFSQRVKGIFNSSLLESELAPRTALTNYCGLVLDGGSATEALFLSMPAFTFANAASNNLCGSCLVSSFAQATASIVLKIMWIVGTTQVGVTSCVWGLERTTVGGTLSATPGVTESNVTHALPSGAASGLVQVTTLSVPFSANANNLLSARITRYGSDGSDTMTGNAHLVAAWLEVA